jgi:outer membrane protein assembly factor BamB
MGMIRSSKSVSVRLGPLLLPIWLIVVALLAATISPVLTGGREPITIQWKRELNQPVSLAMSADGRFFGSVDKSGDVRIYDQEGRLLWQKTVEGATDVLIARHGQSLLIYSKLNQTHQQVYFYTRSGRLLWKNAVDGSVWAGAVSPDGNHAAVTTGSRFAYVYKPDPHHPMFHRWRIDGIGHCITFTPDSKRVLIETLQASGLSSYDIDGHLLWRTKHSLDRQYDIQMSADGKEILGVLQGTQHAPNVELSLWDSQGMLQWKRSLDAFDARALVSPRCEHVAISYARVLSKRPPDVIERKVTVYNNLGQLLWEKGGLFFGPRLVALSPSGYSVIVSDGQNSIYNIDKQGRILSKLTLGGKVEKIISSEDGRRILLYCGDGWLYVMSVEKG